MATVNLDTSTRLDIVCRKNDSFLLELDFGKKMPSTDAPNASSYTFTVKKSMTSSGAVGDFTVTTADSSSGVTSALVKVEASPTDMDITEGLYVYDMSVEDKGAEPRVYPAVDSAQRIVTLIHGTFKVVDDVHN